MPEGADGTGSGQFRFSSQRLQEERHGQVAPDVIGYTAEISACEKCEQRGAALDELSEVQQAQVAPNMISYNGAISA